MAKSALAATLTWTGSSNNDWFVPTNWIPAQAPGDGDEIVITNGTVLLTNATPYLNSFTITNATLTFTNWSTQLSATNVTIRNGGTLTLPVAFTNNVMSNRVWIACSNITIETGGSINANGKGYAYGTPTIPTGQGSGGGPSQGDGTGGGGHGGSGGSGYACGGGGTYGSAAAPLCPGSGGGGSIPRAVYGAHGGGAVLIEATNAVVINGTISANGNSDGTGNRGGGGSGGAIYITCATFAGTNGVIRADGGTGTSTGGGGGGGRIAVVYDTNTQAALPKPSVRFSVNRALGYGGSAYSGLGSLCFSDMALMDSSWMPHNGVLTVTNFTSWSVPSLLVTNGFIRIPTADFTLQTTNDLVIIGTNGILQMPTGGNIACGGDLIVTNGGSLYVYATLTNDASPYYGALVAVTGDVRIASNSWIYPASQNTNGAAPVFRMRNITIAAAGGINADTLGFLRGINSAGYSVHGYGPGHGWAAVGDGSGAGYGGRGGRSLGTASRGITYGDTNAPTLPGSGGAGRTGYAGAAGGNGGGLVRIEAVSNITVDGTITADGQAGTWHGGGSGGGIYLSCLQFIGAGILGADGGNRNGANDGGGGGGQIAVWRVAERHYYQGNYSVSTGLSYTSDTELGTVTLVDVAPPWGTISNNVATNISATNAWMIGNLAATGLAPNEIYCYWGQTDGGTNRNNWANTNYMGTNDIGLITNQVYFLTGETRYYYRFYSLNLWGDDWGEPVASFSTSGGPHVDNDGGVTNVTLTSATLRGEVTGGDPRPDAYIYWGITDGGTNKSAWSNEVAFGPATNWAFSTNISVIANRTYYYRCYASNIYEDAWAPETTNFTVSGPSLAIDDVTVTEKDGVATTNATFTVTLSATSAVDITVFYAASNGIATAGSDFDATNGTLVIAASQLTNTVTVVVTGDGTDEYPSENFYVNLSAPTNATISDGTGEAIVLDNDDVKETRTWTGTGNWTSATNWTPTGMPSADDDVILASGTATLSNSMTIASLIVSNSATLIFTNWTTKLTVASNMAVRGTITLPAAFTNNAMSNRVWIACSNITIETGGIINADGKGYAKGTPTMSGQGPGGGGTGGNAGGGGGHGAAGSGGYNGGAGSAYDSSSAPTAPGSGGGGDYGYSTYGANGGGAVLIEAGGAVAVHGTISANGNSDGTGGRGGGGSGGAVYITCNTFAGTNGVVRADGGTGTSAGGAGGGGRISVLYDTNAQASLPKSTVRFSANRAWGPYGYSGIGTLYFPDMALMNWEWMAHNGVLTVPNVTSWSVPSLLVTNGYMRIPTAGFVLETTNDFMIVGTNGILQMPTGGDITCGRDLVVTNGGTLYVYASATNDATPYYGSLISVARDIRIASNSWIYPYSEETNGAAPVFRMRDILIAAGGGINADAKGFKRGIQSAGYGPGRGYAAANDASGAGYGGRGGRSANQAARGATYGSSNAPALPGSGGGGRTGLAGSAGGNGGGLVRIEATRAVTVDGTITADGGTGNNGGGSGGGIYISCVSFAGAAGGLIGADGGVRGSANDGGGGGGRIAVWRFADQHTYQGTYSVSTGLTYTSDPEVGTVVLLDMPLDVNNDGGASGVTNFSAWLNGNLVSTGGAPTTVYIYWGLTDAGTTNSNWANTTNMGVLSTGSFSNQATSLSAGIKYYYRCYATNSAGPAWASATTNFTTLSVGGAPDGTIFKFY